LFTDLPVEEIARLEGLQNEELAAAKEMLADAATGLCRGAPKTRAIPQGAPA
jgi:tyrosyl-tRNA synthetase